MNKQVALHTAELRIIVGYLGEQKQLNWWPSNFLSPSSTAFLTPIFSRSLLQAQYQGVNEAALRVHDEHIGVGQTYHLFRLPEAYEILTAKILTEAQFSEQIKEKLTHQDIALARLQEIADDETTEKNEGNEGPVNLGDFDDQVFANLLKKAAACYHQAFCHKTQSYPYFRGSM